MFEKFLYKKTVVNSPLLLVQDAAENLLIFLRKKRKAHPTKIPVTKKRTSCVSLRKVPMSAPTEHAFDESSEEGEVRTDKSQSCVDSRVWDQGSFDW